MPGDNARYFIKMLVYKEVYQYFLHIQKKRGDEREGNIVQWEGRIKWFSDK